jgi:hypothetical protein
MYGLYNDGLSSSDCTELNDIIIVNNVLERMKMEVVVAWWGSHSVCLEGEEYHETYQNSSSPD